VIEGFADISSAHRPDRHVGPDGRFERGVNSSELEYVDGIGFPGDQFQYPGNAATVVAYDGDWTGTTWCRSSRAPNATFKDRYLFTASLRADGSSRFAKTIAGHVPGGVAGLEGHRRALAQALQRRADLKLRLSYA